jgi:small subunit ribosomal protein S16
LAVKLRLRRLGRKKKPFYRIIAADSRSPRDGRFIEEIGYYNPISDPMTIDVQEDRALYWLGQGAIPTTTVKSLLRKKGIILRFDLVKRGFTEDQIVEEMKKWEVLQLERQKRLEAQKSSQKKKAEDSKKKAEEEKAAAETAKPTEAPAKEEVKAEVVEQAPQEAPAEETPAEETTTAEAPAEEAPEEEKAAEEAPVEEESSEEEKEKK